MKVGINPIYRRIRELSPVFAGALLLALPIFLPDESVTDAAFAERNDRIAAALAEVPWQIDRWRGEEVPVPAQAQEVLRPNAMLSRRYREIGTNLEAVLVIVHCSDTRDMLGHYPPRCYPANGWIMEEDQRWVESIDPGYGFEEPIDCMRYQFYRNTDWGSQSRIRIYNFFALPGGGVTHELDELFGLAARTHTSAMGVAQIQILVGEGMSEDDARRAARELLAGIQPVLVVLGSDDHVGTTE